MHASNANKNDQDSLFESSWKRPYSDRGIRKMLAKYSALAGMSHSISPHQLRHFFFIWVRNQGVDDVQFFPAELFGKDGSITEYHFLNITLLVPSKELIMKSPSIPKYIILKQYKDFRTYLTKKKL
jgi:integrase/recombinase XerD